MSLRFVLVLLALLAGIGAACGDDSEPTPTASPTAATALSPTSTQGPSPTLTPTVTPSPTSAPASSANATPSPTPTPIPTSTPVPTPTPLTTAEIFAMVSPSVAFIETATSVGSGVLIEGGYLVTNAHVVWPFQSVRVVFSDDSAIVDAPVHSQDLIADLALIGPVETDAPPVALVDRENLTVGSDVFLIGYPGESEEFPQPSITAGILSRLREWEPIGMTYFQTDAAVAGGQSGGVLVSEEGEVIGISSFAFSEAAFGLVASAADVSPRVERLIAGEDVSGLGDRRLPLTPGEPEHEFTIDNLWDTPLFLVNQPAGTTVDLRLEDRADVGFFVLDAYGRPLFLANDRRIGPEIGVFTTEVDAPYLVLPFQLDGGGDELRIAGSPALADGIDFPVDTDYFLIDLTKGDLVEITVDSVSIDPFVLVDFPDATASRSAAATTTAAEASSGPAPG